MTQDKILQLINREIEDIPSEVMQMRKKYIWILVVSCLLIGAGVLLMVGPNAVRTMGLGCFFAISGMLLILSTSIMCHTQLCLFRMIKAIGKPME